MMKLYYAKGACSLGVRIVLCELNIPFEYEEVNLKTKTTASNQDFTHINPKGAVPALVLANGAVLTENTVIQQYLADSVGANSLLPPIQDFSRYRVLEWLSFMATDLHKSFSPLFNPNVPKDLQMSLFVPIMRQKLAFLEEHLRENTFMMGDTFTLPDAYCFAVLGWVKPFGVDLAKEYPHLARFQATVAARPAVQQALQQEGL